MVSSGRFSVLRGGESPWDSLSGQCFVTIRVAPQSAQRRIMKPCDIPNSSFESDIEQP
jgi:hypothetical protein